MVSDLLAAVEGLTALLEAKTKRSRTKQKGSGPEWFDNGICKHSSRSDSRKAASAMIAEIPFELAAHIAQCFRPDVERIRECV